MWKRALQGKVASSTDSPSTRLARTVTLGLSPSTRCQLLVVVVVDDEPCVNLIVACLQRCQYPWRPTTSTLGLWLRRWRWCVALFPFFELFPIECAQAEEALAASEVPVGCIFVRDGAIIAKARNRTNELRNVRRFPVSIPPALIPVRPQDTPNSRRLTRSSLTRPSHRHRRHTLYPRRPFT